MNPSPSQSPSPSPSPSPSSHLHRLLFQPLLLLLLLLPLPTPVTAQPSPPHHHRPTFLRRILHQPLFPAASTPPFPPPPPPTPSSDDEPFFPEIPSYASPPSPPPPPSLPANATSSGPIPTATAQSQSSPAVVPAKKVAIAVSVVLVALGMLSGLAFFVYRHQRCHRRSPSSDSRKLVAPPPPRGFPVEDDDDQHPGVPPQPPNFLYLGTVEPSASGNSNSVKGSPYRKLNSGKRMEFGRYRPSPELAPLPPLVQPPPDSVIQMMSSSDDDEQVASRVTETAFHTPQGSSVVSYDDGYYTSTSRYSIKNISTSDRSNSNGSEKATPAATAAVMAMEMPTMSWFHIPRGLPQDHGCPTVRRR